MRVTFDDLPRRWRCVVPPAAEPLHRDEAKAQCSLVPDQTDWDADFDRWIAAARDQLEEIAEVALLTQTWELALPRFPSGREPIELFRPPVQAIESIRFRDLHGETQELNGCLEALALFPAVLMPAPGDYWPVTDCSPGAVTIRFRTGYGTPATVVTATDILHVHPPRYVNGEQLQLMASGGSLPEPLKLRTTYFVRDVSGSMLKLASTSDGIAIDLVTTGTGQLILGLVPDKAIQAIRLQVAHWFRNRESVAFASSTPVSHAFDSLALSLRWR